MIIRPTHLRFDEEMSLKEDYDYTIKHIIEYGGVFRNHQLLTQFKHGKNAGGTVARRTVALEGQKISRLRIAYPGWFRKSTHPNQIMLSTPTRYQKVPYSKPFRELKRKLKTKPPLLT
jgi:hypothetical protein